MTYFDCVGPDLKDHDEEFGEDPRTSRNVDMSDLELPAGVPTFRDQDE